MAPLEALLEAAGGRGARLDVDAAALRAELEALEREVADKRAEKTIAAQNAVRELLKQKEALTKRSRALDGAAGHVRLALAKLEAARAAGLESWQELKEETLKLTDFAVERLRDEGAIASLKAACSGGTLKVDGSKLLFVGSVKAVPSLRKAVEDLESAFSVVVEVEGVMLRLLESRGELTRFGSKHDVNLSAEAGSVRIAGVADKVKKAETLFKWQLTGKADLQCPRELTGAAKVQAKEVEVETGAHIEILRGGFGGGSIVHIRGGDACVHEAEEQMRAWFDEREGAYSVFVDVQETLKELAPEKAKQFSDDLWHFGQKFGIAATVDAGRVELRGPAKGDWEVPAGAELKQVVDWYAQSGQQEASAKAKAKAKASPEAPPAAEGWGAAPEAEFELGHKW